MIDVPLPDSDSSLTSPPCASAMPLTIYKPSPVPIVAFGFWSWTNLEKSCDCLSLAMPMPVSVTVICTLSVRRCVLIVITPPAGVNLRLLERRLLMTWPKWI